MCPQKPIAAHQNLQSPNTALFPFQRHILVGSGRCGQFNYKKARKKQAADAANAKQARTTKVQNEPDQIEELGDEGEAWPTLPGGEEVSEAKAQNTWDGGIGQCLPRVSLLILELLERQPGKHPGKALFREGLKDAQSAQHRPRRSSLCGGDSVTLPPSEMKGFHREMSQLLVYETTWCVVTQCTRPGEDKELL